MGGGGGGGKPPGADLLLGNVLAHRYEKNNWSETLKIVQDVEAQLATLSGKHLMNEG